MAVFPWQKTFIVDFEEDQKEDQEEKEKSKDQDTTITRHVPWLFKDTKTEEEN